MSIQSNHAERLTILGSTGSIGQSTLDVVARHPERFTIFALTAYRNIERLIEQCLRFKPRYAVVADAPAAQQVQAALRGQNCPTEVDYGAAALLTAASVAQCDTVVAAIVGAAGLPPTLAAARAGKRILLANKEALVMSGGLFMNAVQAHGATLLPVDSEHNAVFQCLPAVDAGQTHGGVMRIILTASGGPFRTRAIETLTAVTPEEACAHPNWSMGRKISVDSATMMNKGLEVIEAHWLFDMSADRIDVLIHPQSVIHSMVSYADGSVIAQLGQPDMRTPIAHALAYPQRIVSGVAPLDLAAIATLTFEPPDRQRFPCLEYAFAALKQGGTASTVLNAANEVAVEAFLQHRIGFTQIANIVAEALDKTAAESPLSLDDVLAVDTSARAVASDIVQRLAL